MNANSSFEQIAEKAELPEPIRSRFVQYMRTRWPSQEEIMCWSGYALEWALRFKDGFEYATSDSTGQAVLQAIDKETL